MAKGGFYAVQNGRSNGVFNNWNECKSQVSGYPGAIYKKFNTFAEAQAFSGGGSSNSGYGSESTFHKNHREPAPHWKTPNAALGITKKSVSKPSPRGRDNQGSYYYDRFSKMDQENSSQRAAPSYSVSNSSSRGNGSRSSSKNYYAVKSSNPQVKDAIFPSWDECKRYVSGNGGLSYKKFTTEVDAENFIRGVSSNDYNLIGIEESKFSEQFKRSITTDTGTLQHRNVYCDGSALGNGKNGSRAGYGVYFEGSPEKNISEPLNLGASTNNRAEIQAVSSALDEIWTDLSKRESAVKYQIKTDSEYVSKLLNDRYMGYGTEKIKTLPNSDLIEPLIKKYAKVKSYYQVNRDTFGDVPFKIEWVKGHAGEAGNEIADELARNGASRA
ncbi:LAFA_0D14092g1_1 [Lachancea sp. 'fantastica']|nr:LAFA_0D14092g1_1 [Lachancea sp. 'fantastica']